jgi:hypothetical protein
VGKEFIEEKLAAKKGALFKPVTPNPFDDLGDDWKNYKQTYDPKREPANEQKERVITFAKVVTKADDAEFAKKLPEFLDLDNFARYMALTTWLVDMDGILGVGQNYYLYLHPKTHKFMFFPWDQDQTFGQFPRGSTAEQRENLTIHRPWSSDSRFLERVFQSAEFKKLYLAKMQEFNSTILQPQTIRAQVDQLRSGFARSHSPGISRTIRRIQQSRRRRHGKHFHGTSGNGRYTGQVDQGIRRPAPPIRPGSACRQISGGNYFLRVRPTTGETAAPSEIGGGKIVAR